MGRKLHYKPGSFYRVDDRTGFPQRAERTRMEWNGLIVDEARWEPRQPQDLVKGVPDLQSVPDARPLAQNMFVGPISVQITANAVVGQTSIPVQSIFGFYQGAKIGCMLNADNGTVFFTTILVPPSGSNLILSQGLPGPMASGNLITLYQSGPSSQPVIANSSLVFNLALSQYLSQTGKTNINQQKFTIALWLKASTTGANQVLYYAGDGSTNNSIRLRLASTGAISFISQTSSSTIVNLVTTATFIDGNWHHVVVAIDTTQGTASNRVLIYVDGSLISAFSTAAYPSQNTTLSNNYTARYNIGAQVSGSNFLNGKLAQVYYIDGQQLTPSSFITGTPGVPKTYSGSYMGVFDFFLPFSNGGSTALLGADGSGEGNAWMPVNMTTANQSADYP
jgi:Concanavalin A-like lectin/glucanases superfamily